MIEFVEGDFFDFDADIRINTVNCVGVMGAGVALAFKTLYPEMFKEYARQCKAKLITPGNPSVWKDGDMFSKSVEIINFPTKDHWRKPSEYEYIESGLVWLADYLSNKCDLTVTLPALGCGHGGLDWKIVKQLIVKYLNATPNRILVFEPSASKKAGKTPSMSPSQIANLEAQGITILNKSSPLYPSGLMRYTEKDLYSLGNGVTSFDISIISSTKPSEEERIIINDFVKYCRANNLSILFGGSLFDKKMAYISMCKGVGVGVFLPSGILKSAEKMKVETSKVDISVLSIGDPFKSFDRKEYMPSVLSRMLISKSVLFTCDNLVWLKKQNKIFKNNCINSYFINSSGLQQEDYLAAIEVDAKPIESVGNSVTFKELRP